MADENPKLPEGAEHQQSASPTPDTAQVSDAAFEAMQPRTETVKIADVASALGLSPEKVTLPNGREVMSIVWKPEHLEDVFRHCDNLRQELKIGRNDVVVVDGVCPTWLLPTITHAFHPSQTAVKYPQGGPDATLPISGALVEGEGTGTDVSFTVKEEDDATVVEFALSSPQVDAEAVVKSITAPNVPHGKPVRITGRGPIAIAATLAEAYAHKVPAVSCFQPGTGHVTCISHSDEQPLGTVSQ
jgi:CRISPR-associated Csx3 family protein